MPVEQVVLQLTQPTGQPDQPAVTEDEEVSIFKARGRVRELPAQVAAPTEQLHRLGAFTVADLEQQAAALREEVHRLRNWQLAKQVVALVGR